MPLSVLHKHVPNTVLKRQCRPVHSHSLASTVALAQFELALLLQLLTGYEPCTLTQLAVGSTHLEGLTTATALKSNLISPLCKLFLLLGKSGKFWDLCLGKQGTWLVLQSLSIGLEVVHPSLLLVRPFPGTLHPPRSRRIAYIARTDNPIGPQLRRQVVHVVDCRLTKPHAKRPSFDQVTGFSFQPIFVLLVLPQPPKFSAALLAFLGRFSRSFGDFVVTLQFDCPPNGFLIGQELTCLHTFS